MPKDDKGLLAPKAAEREKPPAPAPQKPVKVPRKAPDEWARETGNMLRRGFVVAAGGVKPDMRSPQHRAAAVAHGWDARRLRGDAPIAITLEDYKAAIQVAKGNDSKGRVLVHPPALCPELRKAD